MSAENTSPSTSVEEDIQVLIKASFHLCNKAYPENGRYSVPNREFERLRAKSNRLQKHFKGE